MGISPALGVEAELVAVERQAGLEAQRVAGAETDGRGARRDQRVPQGRRLLRGDEELEAERLAGVAGAADARAHGERRAAARVGHAQGGDAELVAQRLGQAAVVDQPGEDVPRLLALQGEHRDGARCRRCSSTSSKPREMALEVLPSP